MGEENEFNREIDELLSEWVGCFTSLNELKFPIEDTVSVLGSSFEGLNNTIVAVLEFGSGFTFQDDVDQNLKFILTQPVRKLLSDLRERVNKISTIAENVRKAGGLKNFDSTNAQATTANGQTHDLSNSLNGMQNSIMSLCASLTSLYPVLEVRNTADLSARSEKLSEICITLKEQSEEFRIKLHEAETLASSIMSENEKIGEILEKAQERLDEQSKTVQVTSDEAAKGRARTNEIEETYTKAEQLNMQVLDYQNSFEKFDNQLKKRLTALEEADTKTETAEEENKEREIKIDELTEKASDLIKGATVVGLATSFKENADQYKDEMNKASNWFMGSIIFLVTSTAPLAFYIFPILGEGDNPAISLAGVASRLILLVPATWMTKFHTRRYYDNFSLYRQYMHKRAIAQSIEGFKREAPDYEQEVTAAAFIELKDKPLIESNEGKSKSPNPVLDYLTEKLQHGLFTGKPVKKTHV